MGSTASKACCSHSSPSSSSSSKPPRSRPNWPFHSSCLGTASGSREAPPHDQNIEDGGDETDTETESDELKIDFDRKVKNDMSCMSSNVEVDGSSSGRSSSTPSRFLSRFNFIPGNLSFRLSRAASLGSSRAYPDDQELRLHSGPAAARNFLDRIDSQQGNNLLPPSLISGQDSLNSVRLNGHNLHDNQMMSSRDGGSTTRVGVDGNIHSPRVLNELDNVGTRRLGAREPVGRNVRFSRTLSVGRLRDRVLRRSSLTDLTLCPLQQEREVRDAGQSSRRYAFDGDTRMPTSEGNAGASPTAPAYPPSNISSSLFGIQDTEETSRSREARYHDLLEQRSNFLERGRRIRSQVRALQRLGSRFENMSGHERSCILSGQHRTGHCTCHASNRDTGYTDDTNTQASISRIVMLAEALFEVLDEIHQQSVVLSSQPSMSSIGSIPAPNEAVESLPVKHYTKPHKHYNEEVAQCYICLVEYEEGDSVRILPCHHEFHRTCVDKWLKEIHRVCPLCRGDICKYDLLPPED